jgi:hypothetical protein
LRVDVYVKEVLARCEALKRSGFWLAEPNMRPRAWIDNFDLGDRFLAAQLLERFVFYSRLHTDSLLKTSFNSLLDGLQKGPTAPSKAQLLQALQNAVFTPVTGETPNPTDSGYLMCRRARQLLAVSEDQIKETKDALHTASSGGPVVFVDDFIGSGDQFLTTWRDCTSGASFEEIHRENGFTAIYISLVGTKAGIDNIGYHAPAVALCVTHKIDINGTLWGIKSLNPSLYRQLDSMLQKYSSRLTPNDQYMLSNNYLTYGYKHRGLFFGFEHSVPDATLPIFWCRGTNNWEPLIERT